MLRADTDLKYGQVREFMARAQQVGFPGLNFMVGEKHRAGTGIAEYEEANDAGSRGRRQRSERRRGASTRGGSRRAAARPTFRRTRRS